jgi:carbamoyl-phosphate synthase small subunit
MSTSLPARIVLEDGLVFPGHSFGRPGEVAAEVVFNTTHTGYQEVLTDPSYRFEAVTFTVPILGIYGVVESEDDQSGQPQAAAIVCREVSKRASSYRSRQTLPEYMDEKGLLGIEGVDTRTLVKHLRDQGSKIGVLTTGQESVDELVDKARAAPRMTGLDLAREVTCRQPFEWGEGFLQGNEPWGFAHPKPSAEPGSRGHVVVVDFGAKRDILRHLASRGLRLTVVPANTPAGAILERQPDGILLSNGPGDPAAVAYGIETAKALIAAEGPPVFGVCLGYQIISLAMGAKTRHMKFGHRGGNHPVREVDTGRVLITSHNHGFAVDAASLRDTPLEVAYESLFDGTLEGVKHRELPVRAVQFHPEAGPGPHDAAGFFDHFLELMAQRDPQPSLETGA